MKRPDSILKITQFCNKCPCSVYVNTNKPTKLDLIIMIGSIILIIFFVVTIFVLYMGSIELATTPEWTEPLADMTLGEFYNLMLVISLLVPLMLFITLEDFIYGYFRNRKRPRYPTGV